MKQETISPLTPSTWPTVGERVCATFGDIIESGLVTQRTGQGWVDTRLTVAFEDEWRGEFAEGSKVMSLCNIRKVV